MAFLDAERAQRLLDHGRPDGLTIVGVRTDLGDVAHDDLVEGPPYASESVVRRRARRRHRRALHLRHHRPTQGCRHHQPGDDGEPLEHGVRAAPRGRDQRTSTGTGHPTRHPRREPLFHIDRMAAIIGSPMGGVKIVIMRKWDVDVALRLRPRSASPRTVASPRSCARSSSTPRSSSSTSRSGASRWAGPRSSGPPGAARRALRRQDPEPQRVRPHRDHLRGRHQRRRRVRRAPRQRGATEPHRRSEGGRSRRPAPARRRGRASSLPLPQVVKGYWGDPPATTSGFVDGWFHSGDVGYVDDDGFVYVVDRIKDVVIRGGENVYCAEVEAVLFEHPAIADVAVVGIVETTLGERVCAVVVRAGGVAARSERGAGLRDRGASPPSSAPKCSSSSTSSRRPRPTRSTRKRSTPPSPARRGRRRRHTLVSPPGSGRWCLVRQPSGASRRPRTSPGRALASLLGPRHPRPEAVER